MWALVLVAVAVTVHDVGMVAVRRSEVVVMRVGCRVSGSVVAQGLPVAGGVQQLPGPPPPGFRRWRQGVGGGLVGSGLGMGSVGRLPEPLADDFFRLCHDDRSGGLLLDDAAVRIGLASALLGELGWLGRLTVERGLVLVGDGLMPADAAAHGVLDDIRGELEPRDVRTWLTFLSLDAYERVARRLVAANHLVPREGRRMLRRYTYYVPTDRNYHAWPRARLATGLARRRPVDMRDVHLLGIADATGLLPMVLDWGGPAAQEYCAHLMAQAHPDVQVLVQQTRAVIGNKVMGRR